jgi:hypothetical protein
MRRHLPLIMIDEQYAHLPARCSSVPLGPPRFRTAQRVEAVEAWWSYTLCCLVSSRPPWGGLGLGSVTSDRLEAHSTSIYKCSGLVQLYIRTVQNSTTHWLRTTSFRTTYWLTSSCSNITQIALWLPIVRAKPPACFIYIQTHYNRLPLFLLDLLRLRVYLFWNPSVVLYFLLRTTWVPSVIKIKQNDTECTFCIIVIKYHVVLLFE